MNINSFDRRGVMTDRFSGISHQKLGQKVLIIEFLLFFKAECQNGPLESIGKWAKTLYLDKGQ